jgi:NodT family efflux transporter outer membrane factor (OMF) lipoprotein
MRYTTLSIAVSLALLAGCATHSDIQPQAKLNNPAQLGALDQAGLLAAGVRQDYWKQLGDPQLDALVEEALADAPGIKVADSRIRRALAITDAAQSALLPQVSLDFESTQQRFTEVGMIPAPLAGTWRTNNRLALDAGIDLDVWGKYRRALQGAEAQRELARTEAAAARIALSSAIARAWVEFDRLHRQRDAIDRLQAARSEMERLQGIRVKAGLEPDIDRTAQRYAIAALSTERAQIEERIGLQRNLIAALTGKGPERGAALFRPSLPDNLDAGLPSALPSDLLANRPDVLAARWRVEAAEADIDVARKQFYPSVNLVAFLGFSSLGLENLIDPAARIAGIGPAVKLPIFEGGRLRANLSMKAADRDTAVEQYNSTLVDALHEVADQARSLAGAQLQSRESARALEAARRGVDLVEKRIARRLSNRIQWLGAQMQVLAQERVEIDLHARRLDTALALERALGGGFTSETNPFTLVAKQTTASGDQHGSE